MQENGIRKVVVVGGGTAGWMSAALLSRVVGKNVKIELVESEEIGTVGVGEATIPQIRYLCDALRVPEAEFLAAVNGTYKVGIQFVNWARIGDRYIHTFGDVGRRLGVLDFHQVWLRARQLGVETDIGDYSFGAIAARDNKFDHVDKIGDTGLLGLGYAFHFDASLVAKLLRKISEAKGVTRTEGRIRDVKLDPESGFIESVKLESGQVVAGDLFIDCTGFRGLLIEQELKTGWEDWSHWLRNDSAVAVQTESLSSLAPYTRSMARSAGWQWKIPLQHRVGNGLVYSSPYMPDEEATRTLLDNVDGKTINEPRVIKFRTGRRLKQWNRNCVALGLSSGFLEPLESTSIHLIQNGIIRLIKLFPFREIDQAAVDQYNEDVKTEIEFIRDFIILHYHLTQRGDSPYWDDCRNMQVPDTLLHKVSLFASSGLIAQHPYDLFADQSWAAVMLGQGIMPGGYHPVVEMAGDDELRQFLTRIRASVRQIVDLQPMHREFVAGYCSASPPD